MRNIKAQVTSHRAQEYGKGLGAISLRLVPCARCLSVILVCFLMFTPLYAADLNYAAPSDLPGVEPGMQTAGYWIARHPYPDRLIMNPTQVAKFNAMAALERLIDDMAVFPEIYDGAKLRTEIAKTVDGLKSRTLFQENSNLADDAFYAPLVDGMGLSTISPVVDVRFGFVTSQADERILPTNFHLAEKAGDADFDELQNSGLEVGTPVVVLHSTGDGRWLYVKDRVASGWVEARKVVLVSQDEFRANLRRRDIVVATSPRVDVFFDRAMTQYAAVVRMGTRFVLKNADIRVVEVLIPEQSTDGPTTFRSGFIAREDVAIGYLPFTPRTILRQAFKMLGSPYGWGDAQGRQDCSRFIQMVFATVGLDLPRNSGEQGKAGESLGEFTDTLPTPVKDEKDAKALSSATSVVSEKTTLLSTRAVGGLTLLRLKGHIMLYLGMVNDRYFAIHATWAYREAVKGSEDRARVINRVVVSDLSLGEGSKKGSLLERILSVRLLQ